MFGSEEMPTKDMTGAESRYVKYSVGLRPHVMTEDLTPLAASLVISCSTSRWGEMLNPPASPRSEAIST